MVAKRNNNNNTNNAINVDILIESSRFGRQLGKTRRRWVVNTMANAMTVDMETLNG
jgi:hypothetical protein